MAKRARALIFNSQGQVLLGLHSNGEFYLVGGHSKPNEHIVDTLLREVQEETGITASSMSHLEYLWDYLDDAVFFVIADGTLPNPSHDPDSEFQGFIWSEPEHLPDSVTENTSDIIYRWLVQLLDGHVPVMASINDLESAIDEFKLNSKNYSGFMRLTEGVEQELYDELFKADEVPLYRCITVEDPAKAIENLKNIGTGIFWTHNPGKATCYWGDTDAPYKIVLEAVGGDAVDWLGTLEQHLKPQTAGEDEVRLLPHKQILIKSAEIYNRETKKSELLEINKKLPTGGDREDKYQSVASVEDDIFSILRYCFDEFYKVELPKMLVTIQTTSEAWLAKTLNAENGLEVVVNEAILQAPRILRQAVVHESIHVYTYSQKLDVSPHGDEFKKWADLINSEEGANYVGTCAEDTKF